MLQQVLDLITTSLGAVVGMVETIFSSIPGMAAFFFSCVLIYFVVRGLLIPLVGNGFQAGSSDTVTTSTTIDDKGNTSSRTTRSHSERVRHNKK